MTQLSAIKSTLSLVNNRLIGHLKVPISLSFDNFYIIVGSLWYFFFQKIRYSKNGTKTHNNYKNHKPAVPPFQFVPSALFGSDRDHPAVSFAGYNMGSELADW